MSDSLSLFEHTLPGQHFLCCSEPIAKAHYLTAGGEATNRIEERKVLRENGPWRCARHTAKQMAKKLREIVMRIQGRGVRLTPESIGHFILGPPPLLAWLLSCDQ